MLSTAAREALAPTFKLLRLLWGAFTVSILVFFLLTQILPRGVASDGGISDEIHFVFAVVALSTAILSMNLPRFLVYSPARMKHFFASSTELDQSTETQSGAMAAKRASERESLSSNERFIFPLRNAFVISSILQFAMNESVALYGLLLFLLGAEIPKVISFFLGALLLNIICFPREKPLFDRIEQAFDRGRT